MAGPTSSGKISFCIKLLQQLDSLRTETRFKGGIIWCYSEAKAVPCSNLANYDSISYIRRGNAQGDPSLILDDLLIVVYSKDVCDLFTKGSRHRNINVLLLTQNISPRNTL